MSGHGFPWWRDLENEILKIIAAAAMPGADVGALMIDASREIDRIRTTSYVDIDGRRVHRTVADALLSSGSSKIAVECFDGNGSCWRVYSDGETPPLVMVWSTAPVDYKYPNLWSIFCHGLRVNVLGLLCVEIDGTQPAPSDNPMERWPRPAWRLG